MRALVLCAMALVSCGGETTTDEPTDSSVADTRADGLVADSATDTKIDSSTTDSTAIDSTVDSSADSAAIDTGKPDVSVPETGTALTTECSAAGGVLCTNFRWNICPAGFEPVSSTDHYACGTAGGWCCRPAPASPCASSGLGNCLPTCPIDCWQPVTDTTLTCDGTKKCCRDVCK